MVILNKKESLIKFVIIKKTQKKKLICFYYILANIVIIIFFCNIFLFNNIIKMIPQVIYRNFSINIIDDVNKI